MNQEDPRLSAARKEVRRLRASYRRAVTFTLVVGVLVVINLLVSPERLWAAWIVAGWGLALLVFAARRTLLRRAFGAEWEAREIRRRVGHLG